MTRPLEDQLHAYAEHVDEVGVPVSVREALSRVDAVRVSDEPSTTRTVQWRNLAVVGGVAALLVVVVAAPFLFGGWVESTDAPPEAAGSTTIPAPTTVAPTSDVAPGETVVRDTEFGQWHWVRLAAPDPWSMVWHRGELWSMDSQRGPGQPAEVSVSRDGVDWEMRRLPEEMDPYHLYLFGRDDDIYVAGATPGAYEQGPIWSLDDSGAWVEAPADVLGAGLTMPTDGFTARGVEVVGYGGEATTIGDVVLVAGGIAVDLPPDVREVVGDYSWAEESANGDDSSRTFGYGDESGQRHEVSVERTGASIAITVWDGLAADGAVLHEASVTAPDEATAARMVRGGVLPSWTSALWSSSDGGVTYTRIEDPFGDLIEDAPDGWTGDGWAGYVSAIERGGRFLVYGRVPSGENRWDATIGAVASSPDGANWEVITLPDVVNPGQVLVFHDTVLWESNGSATHFWSSDDGIHGEMTDVGAYGGSAFVVGDLLVTDAGGSIMISPDARTWARVGLPETSSYGSGMHISGGRLFYVADHGPDESDSVTWMGWLEN